MIFRGSTAVKSVMSQRPVGSQWQQAITTTLMMLGIIIRITHDNMMFDLSSFYHYYYKPSKDHPNVWRIALTRFLSSPVMRDVSTILKREAPMIQILRREEGIFLHIGLLSLVMVDLRLLGQDEMPTFHRQLRDVISSRENKLQVDVRLYSLLADKIIELARSYDIAVEPSPWIDLSEKQVTRMLLPVTRKGALDMEDRLTFDAALNVIYVMIAAAMKQGIKISVATSTSDDGEIEFGAEIEEAVTRLISD
jgi:hypothetical protein